MTDQLSYSQCLTLTIMCEYFWDGLIMKSKAYISSYLATSNSMWLDLNHVLNNFTQYKTWIQQVLKKT